MTISCYRKLFQGAEITHGGIFMTFSHPKQSRIDRQHKLVHLMLGVILSSAGLLQMLSGAYPAMASNQEDPIAGRLGDTRNGFESRWDLSSQRGDEEIQPVFVQYDLDGYDWVGVGYYNNTVISVQVTAESEATNWNTEAAEAIARLFLPSDIEVDSNSRETASGTLITFCHSASLEAVITDEIVSLFSLRNPGDCQFSLDLSENGGVSGVRVDLGSEPKGEILDPTSAVPSDAAGVCYAVDEYSLDGLTELTSDTPYIHVELWTTKSPKLGSQEYEIVLKSADAFGGSFYLTDEAIALDLKGRVWNVAGCDDAGAIKDTNDHIERRLADGASNAGWLDIEEARVLFVIDESTRKESDEPGASATSVFEAPQTVEEAANLLGANSNDLKPLNPDEAPITAWVLSGNAESIPAGVCVDWPSDGSSSLSGEVEWTEPQGGGRTRTLLAGIGAFHGPRATLYWSTCFR